MSVSEPKTVLVVDDEADVVRFMAMALEDAGFNVVTASNGIEALERIKEKAPDIISLDVVMPKGSGVKLYREVKKNDAWSKIPILVVTGHAKDDLGRTDLKEMTLSGPGVYLEKPVTAQTYVNAIKKGLGMPVEEESSKASGIKDEIASLMENADPETLKKIRDQLKSEDS